MLNYSQFTGRAPREIQVKYAGRIAAVKARICMIGAQLEDKNLTPAMVKRLILNLKFCEEQCETLEKELTFDVLKYAKNS